MESVKAPIAHRPAAPILVGDDRLTLLYDGGETYAAMLAAIAAARSTICLETYIFCDDLVGRRFGEALSERARAGVEVNLMFDAWGSSIGPRLRADLTRAGVRLRPFHPFRWHHWAFRLWRRDHRKLLTVDGRVGFAGGINIARDYADPLEGGRGWRDTNVRIEGPRVRDLERVFLRVWRSEGGPTVDARRYEERDRATSHGVAIVTSDFVRERHGVRRAYLHAIRRARSCLSLTQAYFLPPMGIRRALRQAASRGVAVRIIVGATTDLPAILYAARAMYGRLLRVGIRIFEWRGRVLHAKTATIDGHWSTVGSSNFDFRSMFLNLELNVLVDDAGFAAELEESFTHDLESCTEVTLDEWQRRPWWMKLISAFAYLFRDWL